MNSRSLAIDLIDRHWPWSSTSDERSILWLVEQALLKKWLCEKLPGYVRRGGFKGDHGCLSIPGPAKSLHCLGNHNECGSWRRSWTCTGRPEIVEGRQSGSVRRNSVRFRKCARRIVFSAFSEQELAQVVTADIAPILQAPASPGQQIYCVFFPFFSKI